MFYKFLPETESKKSEICKSLISYVMRLTSNFNGQDQAQNTKRIEKSNKPTSNANECEQ